MTEIVFLKNNLYCPYCGMGLEVDSKGFSQVRKCVQMNKINELTPEQEQQLIKYREEWLRIGRSCEPSDRNTTERVFTEMYSAFFR